MQSLVVSIKKPCVITSFITPWILGYGYKTPEQAKQYIKYGKTLCPGYYPGLEKGILTITTEGVYLQFMDKLFNENNIDDDLTQIIGENVYVPWDCLSGIYQLEINKKMGLVARPDGITKNNECVVMVDNFTWGLNGIITEEELKIKLLATMAVWKAKKGVYIITKMKKTIYINFDSSKWEEILGKIKIWAETI